MKLFYTTILIVVLTSLGAGYAIAQPGKTDSIQAILKRDNRNDTLKVRLLLALAISYETRANDSMLAPCKQAVALARQIHDERGLMNSLLELAIAYGYQYHFDSSLACHLSALQTAHALGDKQTTATITMNVGEDYLSLYNYPAAIQYFDSSIPLCEQIKDTLGLAKCMANLSNVYYVSGDYPNGIDYALKGIRLFEVMHDKVDITICYSNIGSIYGELGDYKKSIDYHTKCLDISKEMNNDLATEAALNNIGYTYHEMKNYSKALEYYWKSYEVAKKINDNDTKNIAMLNIGAIYMDDHDYKKALPYFQDCLTEALRLNNIETIIACHVSIGKMLLLTNINEAIDHLKKGVSLAMSINSKRYIQKSAKNLADAYETKKDYANALKYYKIFHDYTDSLYNDENNKKIQQLQFNYQIATKENKISKLEKANVLAKTNNERQRLILIGLSLGLTLFAIFIIALYKNQMKLRKSYKLINQQKKAIEQQTADLKELNTFKDKILSVMSHDLRSPIASINSFVEILDYQELKEEEFTEIRETMHTQIESVMLLVDNLLHWASTSFRGKEAGVADVLNMFELSQLSIALLQNIAKGKNIQIVNEIPRHMLGYGNYEQVDIVIRNLIANAIKFIPQHGKVTVSGVSYENIVAISIADTGVGMTDEQMSKLFTKSQTSTYGTKGEKGIGLGLLLCKEFIELNGGTISVMSEVNKGTVFTVTLPIPPVS